MIAPFFGNSAFSETASLGVALVIGIAFGWFLERSGMGSARKLAGQFYLRDLTVFKVMFTAIITAMGQYALSDVRGSELAVQRLQRSSARYFQRPDRDNRDNGIFSNSFDENATRLSGYAGYARVAKDGGTWLWESMRARVRFGVEQRRRSVLRS